MLYPREVSLLRHPGLQIPHLKSVKNMKHQSVRWNPSTLQWFCTSCGRTSDAVNEKEAELKLDEYECDIPSVDTPRSVPGTETTRLIRKPYKMKLRTERSGTRFVAAKTEDGIPSIRLELFHDTISALKSFTIGFDVLSGTTPDQVKALLDMMNERIVGIVVTAKESGSG